LDLAFQRFLKKIFFANARVMGGHCSVDLAPIKSIVDREQDLRKFTRRSMPHLLSAEQKLRRVTESQSLLTILANLVEKNFQEVIPGS
jgi:hypothetical protein